MTGSPLWGVEQASIGLLTIPAVDNGPGGPFPWAVGNKLV